MKKKIFFLTPADVALAVHGHLSAMGFSIDAFLGQGTEPETNRSLRDEWQATSQQHRIDLVVADLDLIGQRGEDGIIRLIPNEAPVVKIICLSGGPITRQTCPIELYLRKPFSAKELAEAIIWLTTRDEKASKSGT